MTTRTKVSVSALAVIGYLLMVGATYSTMAGNCSEDPDPISISSSTDECVEWAAFSAAFWPIAVPVYVGSTVTR